MSTAARPFEGEIRLARPSDYPRMAELAGQLGYQSTADDIARRLAGLITTGEHVVFVAQLADGTIAGWIGAFVYRCVEADARVEISGDFACFEDPDGRRQNIVERFLKIFNRDRRAGRKRRHLCQGVDAGVGSSRALRQDIFAGKTSNR